MSNVLAYTNVIVLAISLLLGISQVKANPTYKNVTNNESAVVKILVEGDDEKIKLGTGIFINSKGYILTARHTFMDLSEDERIRVYRHEDNTPLDGVLVDVSGGQDLAIIKVDVKDAQYVRFGEFRRVKDRQAVYSIGHSEASVWTVSSGNVTALNDVNADNVEDTQRFRVNIQAAKGYSGGPIISQYDGNVIGMFTEKKNQVGKDLIDFNYAIKSDAITQWLSDSGIVFHKAADQPILDLVKDRGYLICGVHADVSGLSEHSSRPRSNSDESALYDDSRGLESDLCRVVSIAVFGDDGSSTYFKDVTSKDKYELIKNGDVDIAFASTTMTSERDMTFGVDFGPIYFHDGQKFMVDIDSGVERLEDLDDARICVRGGTTTENNLISVLENQLKLTYTPLAKASNKEMLDTFGKPDGCSVMTGDETILRSLRSKLGNSQRYKIIPEDPISYEPLAVVIPEDDSQWRDIVSYAIWSTLWAEQYGIEQIKVQPFAMDTWVSESHDLDNNTSKNIIDTMGNYAEIYDRNAGQSGLPERGRNRPVRLFMDNLNKEHGWMVIPPMDPSRVVKTHVLDTNFAKGSANLSTQDRAGNTQLIEDIKDKNWDVYQIEIVGYTDSEGSFTYNLDLSTRRAGAVAEIYRSGFAEAEIIIDGKGENDLILNADGKEDMRKSRRVEITVSAR